MNPDFWNGRRVLVTGHTGFKGAWLCAWLDAMGARVTGFALEPRGEPNLWSLLSLDARVDSHLADINDAAAVARALAVAQPDVAIHLAAQALVRPSYDSPVETFATNVTGVVTLLDEIRRAPSVRAVVVATSDKCYENFEREDPYAETDRFGGHDPYSASKGAAEIAAISMRRSFFGAGGHPARVATARAGNVIGGGDWSEFRLVPDIVKGCLGPAGGAVIRSPRAVRPWQHVLEPLRGYLMLAERLHGGEDAFADGWNFGPNRADERQVIEAAEGLVRHLGQGDLRIREDSNAPHEAGILRLDAAKAARWLGWRPVLDFDTTLRMTADWYKGFARGEPAAELTRAQIEGYMERLGT